MRRRFFPSPSNTLLIAGMVILISACSAGNGDILPPKARLPEVVSIEVVDKADISDEVAFKNSAAGVAGLKYNWDFGDASNSAEASPNHRYTKAGDYEVSLRITDQDGKFKDVKTTVSLVNRAGVRGLVCSGADDSGWCWQAPRPSGNYITSTTFVNANKGWRVGGTGEIFVTHDGGKTWLRQFSGVNSDLKEVKFFDDKIGWILGANRTLLHTQDGGAHWTVMVSPAEHLGLSILSASSLLLKNRSVQYFTKDSGQTWTSTYLDAPVTTELGKLYGIKNARLLKVTASDSYPNEVLALRDSTGVNLIETSVGVAGENVLIVRGRAPDVSVGNTTQYGKAWAWRSEDGGAHWTSIKTSGLPPGSENSALFSLDHEGKVWFTQYNYRTYRTENGGWNWSEQAGHPYGMADETIGLCDVQILGSRIFASFDLFSTYQFSDDLGKTWAPLNYPKPNFSVGKLHINNGILVLATPLDSKHFSTDKGETWTPIIEKSEGLFGGAHSVTFADPTHGLTMNSLGQLHASSDGGLTWKLIHDKFPSIYGRSMRVQFVNAKTVYLLGQDGVIRKSLDGGSTWEENEVTSRSTDFEFIDEKNGWSRINLLEFRFLVTRNGGKNWFPVFVTKGDDRSANSIQIDATNTATIVGDAGLITQAKDANQPEGSWAWQRRYSGTNKNLRKVYSFDGKTFWAVGDSATVLRSDDGGVNWKPIFVPSLVDFNDIQFASARHGWIVGAQGYVLATQDGGATWTPQATGTKVDLRKIQFIDTKTGWIIGDYGTLLATGTGGF